MTAGMTAALTSQRWGGRGRATTIGGRIGVQNLRCVDPVHPLGGRHLPFEPRAKGAVTGRIMVHYLERNWPAAE